MEPIKLATDQLGIDVDYRVILKDFSILYNQFDALSIENIINPNINLNFWKKLTLNWARNNQIELTITIINQGKLPNSEEGINIDWLNLKQRDYNYQWRLHSFDFCPLLVSAYLYTKDQQYIQIILDILQKWKENFINNNHPEEAFPWNDHSTANRLLNLTYLFFILNENSYANKKAMNDLKNILLIHIFILSCRNFYSFHTNHGVFQAHHTYVASTLLKSGLFGIDFQKINLDRLKEEFHFSFTSSFVHKENSPEYHLVIFKNFLHFNDVLKQLESFSQEFIPHVNEFISGSLKFLAYAIKPNGFLPIIGDTEEKELDNLSYLVGQKNYDYFIYAQSKGGEGKVLPHLACAFAEAGYFFIKTNYPEINYQDQFYLAAKSGFLSKYHRQDDDCHCVLSAYGEDWLVDGGVYKHEHHDPIREYMRSCYSHNLLIPGNNPVIERQTPPSEQRNWGIKNWLIAGNYVEATLSTQMFQGFSYERKFCYHGPYQLKLIDYIDNVGSQADFYQLVFHFPADKKISISNLGTGILVESSNHIMNLHIKDSSQFTKIDILEGENLPDIFIQKISRTYNLLEESKTIIFQFQVLKSENKLKIETNIHFEKKMSKVFILGSCVSRDAFALEEGGEYSIISYLARTSFASGFHHKKTEGLDLSTIASSFQRRMVENDVFKKTTNTLIHNEFDWLIVDLIDERFNLFISENDELFTLSPELTNNCAYSKQGGVIISGSNDFFEKWKLGWDSFIKLAKQYKFLHKIILNKVFWTNQTISGEKVVSENYQSWIDKNNMWLQKLYTHIEQSNEVKVVEYPHHLLIADSNHQWGMQPYHYAKPLYLHLLEYLSKLKKSYNQ